MKSSVSSFYILVNILVVSFVLNKLATAQSIQTDGTTLTLPKSCSGDCVIEGGLKQEANLFHSFERFNVDDGATVQFQDSGVTNIISRVTGSEISEILGTLGTTGGDANLFLLNPNGIIFGANSSLDLNGSFLATTANAIRFGEQDFLDTAPNEIPLLTINPSALSFAEGNRGVIINKSIASAGEDLSGRDETALGLRVPDGKSLLFVGGDVILDGGRVNAFGGRVELGGLAEEGKIEINFPSTNEQNISLSFPNQLQKANISLTNEALVNVPAEDEGDIAINAENISITERSILRAGIGRGLGTSDSQAGNITLNAAEKLEIANDSSIANQVAPEAKGTAGDININSSSLSISDRGRVQAPTFGKGNAGDIKIRVPNGAVEISGNSKVTTVVQSFTNNGIESTAIGQGGNIQIVAKEILLKDSSVIDANTLGQGDAGNIDIFVEEGVYISSNSFISSGVNPGAIGDVGDISIEAKTLFLNNGSQLTANVFGQGKGGSISLNIFDTVSISGIGEQDFSSGIITATESGGQSKAGNIDVNSSSIKVSEGAIISSQTLNDSDGGDISITANNFEATNDGQVAASADKLGNAGNVNIDADDIRLNNGAITAATQSTQGGNITLNIAENLELINDAEITATAGTAQAGGDGGNVIINSDLILAFPTANKHQITAEAFKGNGGNIQISTNNILGRESINIDASSNEGIDGTIAIETPDVDPTSGVVELADVPVDAEAIFAQDLCRFEDDKIAKGSSFIITGRGGLTPTAEDSQSNINNVVGWANREDLDVSNDGTVGVRQRSETETQTANYPKIQQSQGWVRAADGSLWLVANNPEIVPQNNKLNHPDCNTK